MLTNATSTGAIKLFETAVPALRAPHGRRQESKGRKEGRDEGARQDEEIAPADVRAALARVLGGAEFIKARRASRLLAFLVEKRLEGAVRDTNEFTIGIEVFERDPATFNPGEDPVVRVQVGRLRAKLRHYYAAPGPRPPISFAMPVGSYMPVIRRDHEDDGAALDELRLAVMPLAGIPAEEACAAFAQGLREELSYWLFQEFGNSLVAAPAGPSPQPDAAAPTHRLEGSVRCGGDLVRLGLRVVEAAGGAVVWSQQLDRKAPLSLALQEELGHQVSAALRGHFRQD